MSNKRDTNVLIVPCSGIGKVHGLIAREAVLAAIDELGQPTADTMCLGLMVPRDPEAMDAVQTRPCIAVDGCPKLCSYKNLEMGGAKELQSVRVVDAFKGHKGAEPGDATNLSEDGWMIVDEIAGDLVARVRQMVAPLPAPGQGG